MPIERRPTDLMYEDLLGKSRCPTPAGPTGTRHRGTPTRQHSPVSCSRRASTLANSPGSVGGGSDPLAQREWREQAQPLEGHEDVQGQACVGPR